MLVLDNEGKSLIISKVVIHGAYGLVKEISGLDFEYPSNIQLKLNINFSSVYLCLTQRLI